MILTALPLILSVVLRAAGSAFSITVTAKDVYGNIVTGYVGTPSLTYSAGTISPGNMSAFVSGIGTTSVTVDSYRFRCYYHCY